MHEKEFSSNLNIPPDSQLVFKGTRFDVYGVKKGSTSREIIAHPGAVVVLPLLDSEKIVFIHNERFAVGEVLWELPAGTLEKGEEPSETAKRELHEETGYISETMTSLTQFYTSPGYTNEKMYAYVATGLSLEKQHLDESEKITVDVFSWNQALSMLKEGTIKDSKTIATLLYYHTFYRLGGLYA